MAAEKQFENKIKTYLDELGAWHVKFFANAFTKAGIPDILCCLHGEFIAIEVKAANGKPSELQLYNLRKIHEAGGIALLVYPKDWERLKNMLKQFAMGDFFDRLVFKDEYIDRFVPRFKDN